MPGVSIGGATYNLSVTDAAFVATLQRDERLALQTAANIRQQLGALPVGANTAPLRAQLSQAEAAAARASAQIQSRLNQIGPTATAQSRIMGSAFVQQFGAMAAASVSLYAIINSLKSISAAAQAASVAQKSVEVQYGRSGAQVLAFTDQLAASTKTSRTEQAEAAAVAASLRKNYGLTSAEIQTLLQRSTDLASVTGLDVVDAMKRMEAAARGETESSERLGASLQYNALKGSNLLNQSEKDRLQTMGNVEAAHVRLRVLLDQTSFAEGAAAKNAQTGANNLALLDAATKNLNTTIGESTGINSIAGYLATAAGSAENLIKIYDKLADRQREINELRARDAVTRTPQPIAAQAVGFAGDPLGIAGLTRQGLAFVGLSHDAAQYTAEVKRIREATHDATGSQAIFGAALEHFNSENAQTDLQDLTTEMQAAAKAGQDLAAAIQDDHARLAAISNLPQPGVNPLQPTLDDRAKAAQKVADQVVAIAQESIRQQQAAYDRGADQAIATAERERDGLLAASAAKRDGALADLKTQQDATDKDFSVQQRTYERDRDAALKTADAVKSARLDAIQAEEDAESARTATLIRNNERERDHELQQQKQIYDYQVEQGRLAARKLADARTDADRLTRDSRHDFDVARATDFAAQTAADTARHEQRVANLKQEADQAKATGDIALKAIENEKTALQGQADQALKGLDRQRDAEQRRHDAAIANIDQEAARQSAAIQKQLDALDATTAAENRQREDRSQRGDVSTARQGVRDAQATGDPEAVKRAQIELANALDAITQTRLNRQRDAERASLQAQLQAVQQRAQAEKDAADKALALQQARLDAEKQATQDQLATALTALARRADAEKASTDTSLANIQKRADAEKGDYDAHEAAEQKKFADDSARIEALRQKADDARADQRLTEDRAIEDSARAQQAANDDAIARIQKLYDDPDTGILTKIKADQEASKIRFQAERDDAQRTYDDESTRIHTLYDDPDTGLLAKLAAAKTASDDYFTRTTTRINGTYADETAKVNALYNGPFGLVQRLKDSKTASDEYFKTAIDDWKTWGDTTKAALDATNPGLLQLIDSLTRLQALGPGAVGNGQDPGGFAPGTVVPNTGGGVPLTGDQGRGVNDAELAAAFKAAGLTPSLIAAACGPIAAAGLAEAFGEAGKNIDPAEVLKKSEQTGNFDPNVGTKGFEGVAANAGVHVHAAGQAEALAALKAGNPVVINETPSGSGPGAFPGHYLLAQGIDASGNIDLGNTGHIVGLGRTASLSQISAKGGGLRYFVADPTPAQSAARSGGGSSAPSGSAAGSAGASAGSSPQQVSAYIKAKATALGFVNPSIPIAVWTGEGGVTGSGPGDFNTNGKPSSFGPYQLHYGGLGQPHSAAGLGDDFTAQTKIKPGDPRFERASIDFALTWAKSHGWSYFHGWPGDPWAGIKQMATGGVIDRLTGLVDMKTGSLYATAGERGRELVVPMRGSSPAAVPPPAWSSPAMAPLPGSGAGGAHVTQQFFGPWTVKADMGPRQATDEVARLYGGL